MAVQDRFSAVKGEYVRLYRSFIYNGMLAAMPSLPIVKILDGDGVEIASLTSVKEKVGTFYVDWAVPSDLAVGKYYDRWNYTFDSTIYSEETSYFQVGEADSFPSFEGLSASEEITDKMLVLMRALENDFIYEAQHIPLYWEQGLRTTDPAKINFSYKNWRQDPYPMIRKNGKLMVDGWVPDYQGNVFFEKPPLETDDISASYNFSYFSTEELASFLNEGLRAMNAIPPSSFVFNSIQHIPINWEYGILLAAAVHAMRRLVMGLNFQENRIIFGDPLDQAGASAASSAQEIFKTLYQDYSSLWLELSRDIKKQLPTSAFVTVPEYTLPGGRSRWFRYLYTTS